MSYRLPTISARNVSIKRDEYTTDLMELKTELHDNPSDASQNGIEQDMCYSVLKLIEKREADVRELRSYTHTAPLSALEQERRAALISSMQADMPHLQMFFSI